jgi:hypothetical protein
VIRKRLGRVATVLMSAAMLAALAFAGPVSATNPTWAVAFNELPSIVGAGHDAGWFVTVTNSGPSQINDLRITLTSEIAGALPTYLSPLTLSSGGAYSCSAASGAEVCNVGTVVDQGSVTFTVAFHVPAGRTGAFDLNVGLLSGTGDTGSDKPGKSRGDKATFTDSTPISSSSNFDAGFSVTGDTYQTGGSLGRNNKQTTELVTTDDAIPVTITDGVTDFPCDVTTEDTQCLRVIGEWSVLDVNGGNNTDPIKVTLLIWGGSVPGGVGVGDIFLLHADGLGGYVPVNATCDAEPPTNAPCLVLVTKVGSNFKIVAWLEKNGGARGGY